MLNICARFVVPVAIILSPSFAQAEISPKNLKEADALIKAYQSLIKDPVPMPLEVDYSECEGSTCSFNFETDRENFGINVLYKDKLPSQTGRVVGGFRVDPNGVNFDADYDFKVDASEFGVSMPSAKVSALGKNLLKHFGPITGVKGKLLDSASECKVSGWDRVICVLKYQNSKGTSGLSVDGLIDTSDGSLAYIETLEAQANEPSIR